MLEKLEAIVDKLQKLKEKLQQEDVVNDFKKYNILNKEYKDLKKIVDEIEKYRDVLSNIDNNKKMLHDETDTELKEMAKEELDSLQLEKEKYEEDIRIMLIPKDPEDEKNAILEIRAGSGGDEASIFAGDLFRMYQKYCEIKGWKTELINEAFGSVGGYKEVILNVSGDNVFGQLKYEAGVHRVQRVPATESQGRVHTSAASVAVLPEAEVVDVELIDSEIKKDTYRASGAGGQHVNKTESAIRLTHIPTGIVVECQDQRSQMKNYAAALKVLRSRLYEKKYREHMEEISKKRKTMVSTGDRSAKIRTYNFPQGRLTDHRIKLTLYNLEAIMEGEIQEIIDALQLAENAERLKDSGL